MLSSPEATRIVLQSFNHIIWDFDGALFDTYPAFGRAFAAALAELGYPTAAEHAQALAQVSLSHCAATLAAVKGIETGLVQEAFGRHYANVVPAEQPPFAGAACLCRTVVAAGGLNFIVTHRGRQSTWQLLEAYEIGPLFSEVITRDDPFPRKPAPDAFRHLLDRYQLEPATVLAIGDRDLDILAGQALGVQTCRFGAERCPAGADLAIRSLEALLPFCATPGN